LDFFSPGTIPLLLSSVSICVRSASKKSLTATCGNAFGFRVMALMLILFA
jgi:hypothetical protein